MAGRWSNDDIPWGRFDPAKVDPDILAAVKAAALVERNAQDYVAYLNNVFPDDPQFQENIAAWGFEEEQHGLALAAWAVHADPSFDFQGSLARFRDSFQLPLDATASVRGSRAGEMIARCVVECGTSSLYSALRDATDEPVLEAICNRIAGDEFRHYKLFYEGFLKCDATVHLSLWQRIKVAVGRIAETSDDELSMAYWAANHAAEPYDRVRHGNAYALRVGRLYRFGHVRRAIGMVMKACRLNPQGRVADCIGYAGWTFLQHRNRRLARAAA